jgi:hypothetical protein
MNYEDIISLLDKNCKPFLKEMKAGKNFLLRLSPKYAVKMDIIVSTIRKNRKPTDTPIHIHNEMDDMLKNKFGWKPRSEGLFTWISKRKGSKDKFWIHNLNRARLVFPVGAYKYVYSPTIRDVYNVYERFQETADYSDLDYRDSKRKVNKIDKKIDDNFLDWFWEKGLPSYTNRDFAKVPLIRDNIELMLSAPVVYLLSPELIPLLNDEYKLDFDEADIDRPNYELKRKAQIETPEISKRGR